MQLLLDNGRDNLSANTLRALSMFPSQAYASSLNIPEKPNDLLPHFDLTLSHPPRSVEQFTAFEGWLAKAAISLGLTCAVLHDGIVHEAIHQLYAGKMTIGLHLDYFALWHVANDPYARLAQAIQDTGGRPINLPARSRTFTDKANAHGDLVRCGLGVPETFIARPWSPDDGFSERDLYRLQKGGKGGDIYIKPANGFSNRGVVRLQDPDLLKVKTTLAAACAQDPCDSYLVQNAISCPYVKTDDGVERPAYWRVLFCLGDVIPFWWSSREPDYGRPSYRRVTTRELLRFHLKPVIDYVLYLAQISGLDWFSTELCLSEGMEASRFVVEGKLGTKWPVVAIDYLNDQCDVDVQSRWLGAPPDEVVRFLAGKFVEKAWQIRQESFPHRVEKHQLRLVA